MREVETGPAILVFPVTTDARSGTGPGWRPA